MKSHREAALGKPREPAQASWGARGAGPTQLPAAPTHHPETEGVLPLRVSLSGRGPGHDSVPPGCWGPWALQPPGDLWGRCRLSNGGQPRSPPAAKPDSKARRAALAGSRQPCRHASAGTACPARDPLGGTPGPLPIHLSPGCGAPRPPASTRAAAPPTPRVSPADGRTRGAALRTPAPTTGTHV